VARMARAATVCSPVVVLGLLPLSAMSSEPEGCPDTSGLARVVTRLQGLQGKDLTEDSISQIWPG
jgi:hypothetical protein